MRDLPYGRQTIDQDDIDAVVVVLGSDFLTTGPEVERFEAALCQTVGAKHAIVVSSGTAALHLMALALKIPAGDDVILPALTFTADATAFHLAGAEIRFADVDPDTGLMRPEDLEAALAASPAPVRAVVNVHLNGASGEVEELAAICRRRDVPLIEDACHALGTAYEDQAGTIHKVGACGHAMASLFSFHAVKTITMGEGGAIICGDDDLAARLRLLRNHGMTRDPNQFQMTTAPDGTNAAEAPRHYEIQLPGLNYRATDMQCALGRSQLARLDTFAERRRQLVALYQAELRAQADLAPLLKFVTCHPRCNPVWHLLVALIDFSSAALGRGELMRALKRDGIGTQVHYMPLHHQPYYRQRYGPQYLPGADAYFRRALSLPLFPAMADSDVKRVMTKLRHLLC